MVRRGLALLISAASIAGGAHAQLIDQTMTGTSTGIRLLSPARNLPSLPRNNVILPNGAIVGRPIGRPAPTQPTKPRTVYVPYAQCCYYDNYYRQQQPDVNVNVTNVINQPPPITYYSPFSIADAMAIAYGSRGEKLWDPDESIAQERAALESRTSLEGSGTPNPEADRADVASLEAIIDAYYDVQSGPRGTPRNWDRFKSLFADDARLTRAAAAGTKRLSAMTPDDYRSITAGELERGAFAREVLRKVERSGSMVQVFSTYELRRMSSDAKPYARGVNSMQLTTDGKRWWIVSVSWEQTETGLKG